jgi:hypothetical protein
MSDARVEGAQKSEPGAFTSPLDAVRSGLGLGMAWDCIECPSCSALGREGR